MALRAVPLAVLWFVLTGTGDPGTWMIGGPAVLAAALVSLHVIPPLRVNIVELLRFTPVFLAQSFSAAFDVAWRTFALRPPIAPAQITYDMHLPDGLARVAFMNTVSLLPGTLSAAVEGARLSVHVLDHRRDHTVELARLEQTIARIFPEVAHD